MTRIGFLSIVEGIVAKSEKAAQSRAEKEARIEDERNNPTELTLASAMDASADPLAATVLTDQAQMVGEQLSQLGPRVTPTTSLSGSEHSRIDGEPMVAGCVQRDTGIRGCRSQNKGIGRTQGAERPKDQVVKVIEMPKRIPGDLLKCSAGMTKSILDGTREAQLKTGTDGIRAITLDSPYSPSRVSKNQSEPTPCKFCGTNGDHYCPNDICRPDPLCPICDKEMLVKVVCCWCGEDRCGECGISEVCKASLDEMANGSICKLCVSDHFKTCEPCAEIRDEQARDDYNEGRAEEMRGIGIVTMALLLILLFCGTAHAQQFDCPKPQGDAFHSSAFWSEASVLAVSIGWDGYTTVRDTRHGFTEVGAPWLYSTHPNAASFLLPSIGIAAADAFVGWKLQHSRHRWLRIAGDAVIDQNTAFHLYGAIHNEIVFTSGSVQVPKAVAPHVPARIGGRQ